MAISTQKVHGRQRFESQLKSEDSCVMDGMYRLGTETVRPLALMCHALDSQFDRLFNSETICEKSPALSEAYERLFATSLLNLAISIRVGLSGNSDYVSKTNGLGACGFLEVGTSPNVKVFSIKDVCDKIIHADQIFKPIEHSVKGACCRLQGTKGDSPWQFELGVSIFCEYVFDWLDKIEAKASSI